MSSEGVAVLLAHLARNYSSEDYPVLQEQTRLWAQASPLRGVRVIDATPAFANTLAKYVPLLSAGAELAVLLSPALPHDTGILDVLTEAGITTLHEPVPCDIALDCAGTLAATPATYGHVELTKSGQFYYERHPKPVYLVDDSRIKVIETALGTGDGFIRGLAHFGYDDLRDRSIVVFGGGKVGRGAAMRARDAGARVTIVDPAGEPVPGCERKPAADPADLADAWCIVSATGITGALAPLTPQLLGSDAILANLGAEDEFGADMPASRVLNDKAPVNFALAEPTHLRYLDAIMALHNACAVELLEPRPSGVLPPPASLEGDILEIVRTSGIGPELSKVGL